MVCAISRLVLLQDRFNERLEKRRRKRKGGVTLQQWGDVGGAMGKGEASVEEVRHLDADHIAGRACLVFGLAL